MPFGVEVLGWFVELRAWRTLVGHDVDRLAVHMLLAWEELAE